MPFGGLISAGFGLASSIFGKKSRDKEIGFHQQGFNYLKDNPLIAALLGAGQTAVGREGEALGLASGLLGIGGDPEAAREAFDQYRGSTGYEFRLGEGLDAIEGSRAARGILSSGASAKELTRFGQDFASQEYQNYLDQITRQAQLQGNIAQRGLGAATAVGSAGSQAGGGAAGAQQQGTQNIVSGIGGLARGIRSIFGF